MLCSCSINALMNVHANAVQTKRVLFAHMPHVSFAAQSVPNVDGKQIIQ